MSLMVILLFSLQNELYAVDITRRERGARSEKRLDSGTVVSKIFIHPSAAVLNLLNSADPH
jgi:hypothetical protein